MKEFQYGEFFARFFPHKLQRESFESENYYTDLYFLKIFKSTSKLYKRDEYLSGKEKKAYLLDAAFSSVESIVSPIGIIRNEQAFCGLVYPYIPNARTLGDYSIDKAINSTDKFLAFIRSSEILKLIHSQGVVHCDLGVNNILVDSCKKIYIIDMDNCKIGAYNSDCKNTFVKKCANAVGMPIKNEPYFDRFTLHVDLLYSLWGEKAIDYLLAKDKPYDASHSRVANYYLQYMWQRIKESNISDSFDFPYLCDIQSPICL